MKFKYFLINFLIGVFYIALMFLIPELLTFFSLSIVLILIHLRIIFFFKDKLSGVIAVIMLFILLIVLFNVKGKLLEEAFSVTMGQNLESL